METLAIPSEPERHSATFIITDILRSTGTSEEAINECVDFVMNTDIKAATTPEVEQACKKVANTYIESLKRPAPNLEFTMEEMFMILSVFGRSKKDKPMPLSKALVIVSCGKEDLHPKLITSFQRGINKLYRRNILPPVHQPEG